MKLFIFKLHEDCSYADGMAVIVAGTPEEACDYLRAVKENKAWPEIESDDLFIDEDDIVSLVKQENHEGVIYHNEWYLAETFDLSHGYFLGGVRCIAYHDG